MLPSCVGEIELPPVKRVVRNQVAEQQPVNPITVRYTGHFTASLRWSLCKVAAPPEEALFNSLVEQYHYLG